MQLLFFIVLIVLIATIGFWDTLGAIVGGVAILALLVVVLAGVAIWSGLRAFRRGGRGG
jgi:hypothetical protein